MADGGFKMADSGLRSDSENRAKLQLGFSLLSCAEFGKISTSCVIIIISLYHSCTQSHVQTGTNQNRIGTVNHPVVGLRKIVKLPRKYRHKNFLLKLFLGGPYS